MPRIRFLFLPLLAALASFGAACSSDSAGEPDAEVTAEQILGETSQAMAGISTVAFAITQQGAEVSIDGGGLITFVSADGRYAAPSSADAIVAVEALGTATEVGAVAIDGVVWITNPLTGRWEEAPEAFSFDPAQIFDADVGLPALLADGVTDPAPATQIAIDGAYTLTGDVDPARIAELTGGLVTDVTDVELVIDADTHLISTLSFAVDLDGEISTWDLTMGDYDVDVTIEAPELG